MPEFTPAEATAILLSLKGASVAALASLPFGIAIGWLLARDRPALWRVPVVTAVVLWIVLGGFARLYVGDTWLSGLIGATPWLQSTLISDRFTPVATCILVFCTPAATASRRTTRWRS